MPTEFRESDRQLLKSIDERLKEINGKVNRHEEEIFGLPHRGTPGLVQDMEQVKLQLNNARVVLRTLWVAAAFLGLTNIGAIIVFFQSIGTQ